MVSGHPDMARARSYDALLVDTNRRPKLYNDLRVSGHHPQCHSKQRGEKYFPHIPSLGCRAASGLPFTISGELNMSKNHDIIIIAAQCAEAMSRKLVVQFP